MTSVTGVTGGSGLLADWICELVGETLQLHRAPSFSRKREISQEDYNPLGSPPHLLEFKKLPGLLSLWDFT